MFSIMNLGSEFPAQHNTAQKCNKKLNSLYVIEKTKTPTYICLEILGDWVLNFFVK